MTSTVENYLKALVIIELEQNRSREEGCSTSELAEKMKLSAPTINSMVKKLKSNRLINFEPYGKIHLTEKGRLQGIELLRKNRIWKAFLANVLHFQWNEVNEIAEQLQHVKSHKLIARIEEFSGFPRFDPHGEPIPDKMGNLLVPVSKQLSDVAMGKEGYIHRVNDKSFDFLAFADKMEMKIGKAVKVLSRNNFENLVVIQSENGVHTMTNKSASNFILICPICARGKSCGKATCVLSE